MAQAMCLVANTGTMAYEIAGLHLLVHGGGEYLKERMTEYMLPLATEGEHSCDYRINIHRMDKLPPMHGTKTLGAAGMWKVADNQENTIFRGLIGMEEEVGVILSFSESGADISICSPDRNLQDPRDFVCTGYAIEGLCLNQKRMVLHGSCIEANGKAILFSAPSGTGKSTHTGLWKKYIPNTEYINDDTPMLRLDQDDAVYACGTPWCGSGRIQQNRQAPLAAVVLLSRGENNCITRVSGMDVFARILGETRKYPFRDSMDCAASLCAELMERVPVYDLSCDISEDAVRVVYEALGL